MAASCFGTIGRSVIPVLRSIDAGRVGITSLDFRCDGASGVAVTGDSEGHVVFWNAISCFAKGRAVVNRLAS